MEKFLQNKAAGQAKLREFDAKNARFSQLGAQCEAARKKASHLKAVLSHFGQPIRTSYHCPRRAYESNPGCSPDSDSR